MAPGRRSASTSPRRLAPLRDFLHTEAAGGALLVAAAVAALVWANSPWSSSYTDLWEQRLAISIGDHTLDLDLRHWVNDALMTIFFLVVGLEIKRELSDGHLSTTRTAVLPAAAALGGMALPAVLYLAIAGGTAPRGWAIPMATDIALAVGIVAIAGAAVAPSLRAFLLGLAIVDDIGAIVVIAAFYSSGVAWGWLLAAVVAVALTLAASRARVYATPVYAIVGVVLWFALHEAGVHATLAGVAMGLLAPAVPRLDPRFVDVDDLADISGVDAARSIAQTARQSVSVVEWLEHVLHPWSSFVIVPVFALANAGIAIDADRLADAIGSPVVWGIIVGLVIGKPVGVMAASWASHRLGISDPPAGATTRHSWGVGGAAGIGFTVALFVTELAFDDAVRRDEAKLAVLVASIIAALVAVVALQGGGRDRTRPADQRS